MQSLLKRLLVAVVAIPALVYLFYRGGVWLSGFVGVLIVLAVVEAQSLSRKAGAAFDLSPALIWSLLVPWIWEGHWRGLPWPAWLIGGLVLAAMPVISKTEIRDLAAGIGAQIVTVLWIALGFGALPAIRAFPDGHGFEWLLLLFANLWVGDTAAYLFGVWLGKTRLAPTVSPNKTVAGSVAQIIASAIIGAVAAWAGWIDAPPFLVIAASIVVGIVGQLGDLFESVLKRAAGEKDSSHLIPGHGGVLDRFDSAMFAAPTVYALLQLWPR